MVKWPNGAVAVRATHPKIVKMARKARARAKPDIPVHFCQVNDPDVVPAALITKLSDERGITTECFVLIPKKTAWMYGDKALLGLLAHELAHVLVPTEPQCEVGAYKPRPSLKERLDCEIPVDEIAASWFGADRIVKMLQEAEKHTGSCLEPDDRQFLQDEVAFRIKHLQSFH